MFVRFAVTLRPIGIGTVLQHRRGPPPRDVGLILSEEGVNVIPDDVIEGYLGVLLGQSTPGQALHHFLIAAADPADCTILGLPQPDKLKVSMYAIAPDSTVDPDRFVAQAMTAAVVELRQNSQVVYFTGLAMEVYGVVNDGTEVTQNLARRLIADRKLEEHPSSFEATRLYAACRDGRRWTGEHFLTGPRAGTILGPTMRVGALMAQESGLHQHVVRAAVGLSPRG
jgi:hypothetical protein